MLLHLAVAALANDEGTKLLDLLVLLSVTGQYRQTIFVELCWILNLMNAIIWFILVALEYLLTEITIFDCSRRLLGKDFFDVDAWVHTISRSIKWVCLYL